MSIKETKKTVLKEVEIIEKTEFFCDLCKKPITRDCFSRDSFRIKLSRGCVFPEGGSVETDQAYFCEECAEEIKKLLLSKGVNFETIEYDY